MDPSSSRPNGSQSKLEKKVIRRLYQIRVQDEAKGKASDPIAPYLERLSWEIQEEVRVKLWKLITISWGDIKLSSPLFSQTLVTEEAEVRHLGPSRCASALSQGRGVPALAPGGVEGLRLAAKISDFILDSKEWDILKLHDMVPVELLPLIRVIPITFNLDAQAILYWPWSSTGSFSIKSTYDIVVGNGDVDGEFKWIWEIMVIE
nr:LINE-type retrotransposon LIb DNA [Ipomoea batatas]